MDETASSRAAQPRCLECGAETAQAAEECARCGAPINLQQTVTAAPAGWPRSSMWPPENYAPAWPSDQQTGPGSPRRTALVVGGTGLFIFVVLIVVIGVWAVSGPAGSASPPAAGAFSSAASALSPAANHLAGNQLRAGDCLAGSNMALGSGKQWPDYVTVVACTKPHEAEVYFADTVWHQSQAYPGVSKVESQGSARCEAELASYDGIEYGQSALSLAAIVPDSAVWASGDRWLQCVAYTSDPFGPSGAKPVNSSIKGTDQLHTRIHACV